MILTFTFSINQETNEAVFSGNILPQVALQLLQSIVIAEAVRQSKEQLKEVKDGKGMQPVQ